MSLAQRLQAIQASFEEKAPAEAIALMTRTTEELAATGQAERAVGEGADAPDFSLLDSSGNAVSLAEERAKGPVILTFFRGHW